MNRCTAHGCWAPAAALAVEYCAAHQRLIRTMELWLAGIVNGSRSTFDADRRVWERAGRP